MRGYPGSGKSTAAREMASRTGASIVCRDTIRHTMFGRYTNVDEAAVTSMELAQVTNLLSLGKDVIVDAMHLNPRYLCKWATVAAEYSADWDVYDVLTEPAECIVNDADIDRARSGKRVGHEVITRLATRWPMNEWPVIEPRARADGRDVQETDAWQLRDLSELADAHGGMLTPQSPGERAGIAKYLRELADRISEQ